MSNFVKNLSERACVVASDTTWMEDAALQQTRHHFAIGGYAARGGYPCQITLPIPHIGKHLL